MLGVQTLSAQTEYISNGDNLNLQYNFGSPSNHAIPEIWTTDARQGYNFSQSVELPNGVYKLEFQMMYRASKEVGTSTNCVLYATVGATGEMMKLHFSNTSVNSFLIKLLTCKAFL